MKRIAKVTIKTQFDDNPDLSYLGEITKLRDYDLQRKCLSIPTNPDNIKNTEWYMPANHLPHNPKNWEHVDEKRKNEVIAKYGSLRRADIEYAYEDLKRLQDYYAGRWWMEGISVIATIEISEDGEHWTHANIIESLWGIESNEDDKYKQEIINDLKFELKEELLKWGFTESDIATAMSLETEERT